MTRDLPKLYEFLVRGPARGFILLKRATRGDDQFAWSATSFPPETLILANPWLFPRFLFPPQNELVALQRVSSITPTANLVENSPKRGKSS